MHFYISTKIAQAHYKSNSNKGQGYLVRNKEKGFEWMAKADFEKTYAFKLENGKIITDTDITNFITTVDFLQTGKAQCWHKPPCAMAACSSKLIHISILLNSAGRTPCPSV